MPLPTGVVQKIFEDCGALLSGHFLLTSGLHSERYLQCARVLQWPAHCETLARGLREQMEGIKPDLVLSPALGGIVIGYEVARLFDCRAIFAERENGTLRLRRGFEVKPSEKVVVVEDVVTTGGSTAETARLAGTLGGQVLAAASIIDRSGGQVSLDVPFFTLWSLSVPTFRPENCHLCQSGSQPVKPGSRSRA
ncbi:MAG: orotate phosphoribosyltransferase [Acidobacteriota bacterium]